MKGIKNFRGQAHVKIKAKEHLNKITVHTVEHVMLGLSVRHDNKYYFMEAVIYCSTQQILPFSVSEYRLDLLY
jgi:S-ribosylhomocysteine lyase LuxS involved in autoinducer biosynthesis